jgi:membrane protein required for colicin V production
VNSVDAVLVALFGLIAIRGYVRGVFRELMGLAGLALGGAAAVGFWRPAAAEVGRLLDLDPQAAALVAVIGIFIVVNLLTQLAAMALDRMARAMFLTSVARVAGAIVGLGKGVVFFGFTLFVLRSVVPIPRVVDAIDGSMLGAPLVEAAGNLFRATADRLGYGEPSEA